MSNRKCGSCGSQMDADEGYSHEDYKEDVCSECYQDETNECQLCGEDIMPSDTSAFILVKTELGLTCDRPPGIYRVVERPFLFIPLIGSGSMDRTSVCFTDRLPQRDSQYEISGHICKKCARPYSSRFNQTYGKLNQFKQRALSSDYGYGWHLQRGHIQRTVAAHPEMLFDLECEPDHYEVEDLFKWCQLPKGLKTWHDWPALEHRGVKVYFTSEWHGLYGEGKWERMALRPEPRYRDMAHQAMEDPMLVYTHSLPSLSTAIARCRNKPIEAFGYKYSHDDYERRTSAEELRLALVLAIERGASPWADKGAIRAEGVIAA